jgi:hypothetical protein
VDLLCSCWLVVFTVVYDTSIKATMQGWKDRSENLLLNILPADALRELKTKGKSDATDFDGVSILYGFQRIYSDILRKN